MKGTTDEWSAQCRGQLRDNMNIKDDTHIHPLINFNKAEMIRMIMMAKWYSRNYEGLKLRDISSLGFVA